MDRVVLETRMEGRCRLLAQFRRDVSSLKHDMWRAVLKEFVPDLEPLHHAVYAVLVLGIVIVLTGVCFHSRRNTTWTFSVYLVFVYTLFGFL